MKTLIATSIAVAALLAHGEKIPPPRNNIAPGPMGTTIELVSGTLIRVHYPSGYTFDTSVKNLNISSDRLRSGVAVLQNSMDTLNAQINFNDGIVAVATNLTIQSKPFLK